MALSTLQFYTFGDAIPEILALVTEDLFQRHAFTLYCLQCLTVSKIPDGVDTQYDYDSRKDPSKNKSGEAPQTKNEDSGNDKTSNVQQNDSLFSNVNMTFNEADATFNESDTTLDEAERTLVDISTLVDCEDKKLF
ncbi:hypothetical protein V5O48_016041 [Marasmius crinis-equi]|uniref:Uncharacterized protein n=1 Tax=Marasmius crinis-equi TaxID=585013 RepID=A0ABR3ESV8_9AGAR